MMNADEPRGGQGPAGGPADWIFHGGPIRTMNRTHPRVEAVAVRDGGILSAGSLAEAMSARGPATRVRDLRGAALYPGFIDAHAHVGGFGKALATVKLNGARSAAEAARRVSEAAARTGTGAAWIEGRGWDQNLWPGAAFPSWRDLEPIHSPVASHAPVALRRVDGHALWVNRAALGAAEVNAATADPPGGKILRDPDGSPSGILIDRAMDLVIGRIPPPPATELVARLRAALREIAAAGLTGVMDAGVNARGIAALRALGEEDGLLARVDVYLSDEPDLLEAWWTRGPETGAAGGLLSVCGVKLYADGALGSRGAALLEDYSDDPGNRGLLLDGPEHLLAVTRRSLAAGFAVAIHAIGDRANREVLDVFERALGEMEPAPGGPAARGASRLCRLEHAQILTARDIPRLGRLGIVASVQPTHATSDMSWAEERLGPGRIRFAYAWRSVLAGGAILALGSDFPIESHRPLLGIHAAVTRRDLEGRPPAGWYPEECLTLEEALRGFTLDAARAAGAGASRGSIEPRKEADLVCLARDLYEVAPEEIPSVEILFTMTAGRMVYERENE